MFLPSTIELRRQTGCRQAKVTCRRHPIQSREDHSSIRPLVPTLPSSSPLGTHFHRPSPLSSPIHSSNVHNGRSNHSCGASGWQSGDYMAVDINHKWSRDSVQLGQRLIKAYKYLPNPACAACWQSTRTRGRHYTDRGFC